MGLQIKKSIALVLCLSSTLSLAVDYDKAWQVFTAESYVVAARNVEKLKELRGKASPFKGVTFERSGSMMNHFLCRGSYPLYLPRKESPSAFTEAAMNSELTESGLIVEGASRHIQVRLDEFDFSTGPFGPGQWRLQATISAGGERAFVVKTEHEFSTTGSAREVCVRTTMALEYALTEFLYTVYSDPRFLELVK